MLTWVLERGGAKHTDTDRHGGPWNVQCCTIFPYPRESAVYTTSLFSITLFCSVHVWLGICLEGPHRLCKPYQFTTGCRVPSPWWYLPPYLPMAFQFLCCFCSEQAYALHTLGKCLHTKLHSQPGCPLFTVRFNIKLYQSLLWDLGRSSSNTKFLLKRWEGGITFKNLAKHLSN